jgi:hypothetical protein
MRLEARGVFDLVHIKDMLDTWHLRAIQAAAGGQHQAVVLDGGGGASRVAVGHLLTVFVDAIHCAFNELHVHRVEQWAQRRHHGVHVGLVETWADAQFRLRGEQADLHVVAVMFVQQAGRAQCAPDTTEPCANNKNVLFHGLLLERRCCLSGTVWSQTIQAACLEHFYLGSVQACVGVRWLYQGISGPAHRRGRPSVGRRKTAWERTQSAAVMPGRCWAAGRGSR